MGAKLRRASGGILEQMVYFLCPGCLLLEDTHDISAQHVIPITGPRAWEYNDQREAPTFKPSIKVTHGNGRVCHSWVTDGRIQFLGDCSHPLAGQTVDLPDIE